MEKFNNPVNDYKVESFSYLHGARYFDGRDWFVKGDKTFTKYPPKEGTCEVTCEGNLIFAGDWCKLPEDFRERLRTWKPEEIEETLLAAAARKEKNRLQEEEAEWNWQEERAFHGRSI